MNWRKAPAGPARTIGLDEPYRSKKFDGAGFYMMAEPFDPGARKSGYWCEEDGQYIRMSKEQGGKTELWMGARAFDRQDVWRFYTVDEIDRRNGLGKYAEARE